MINNNLYKLLLTTGIIYISIQTTDTIAAQLTTNATIISNGTFDLIGGIYQSSTGTSFAEATLVSTGPADGLPAGATFNGTSRASADFGTLRTYINADITNYSHQTFFLTTIDPVHPGGDVGYASAASMDTFTVNSPVDGLLAMSFDIDGVMNFVSDFTGVFGEIGFNAYNSGNVFHSEKFTSSVSTTINFNIPYLANTPTDVNFLFYSNLKIFDEFTTLPNPYSVNPIMDFFNTATLTDILVTDALGAPIQGATIETGSGAVYPISQLNAVPVPAAFWLFGSGLLGLIGIARRKKV